MSDSRLSDAIQGLDDFEPDVVEGAIAGQLKTECLVGDGAFLEKLVSVRRA